MVNGKLYEQWQILWYILSNDYELGMLIIIFLVKKYELQNAATMVIINDIPKNAILMSSGI